MDNVFFKDVTAEPGIVIAIIFGYNEQDVITSTVYNALSQGLHIYYVDDGSNDDTRLLIQRFFHDEPRVGYQMMDQSFRAAKTSEKSWSLKRQLEFKTKLARTTFKNYKWLLHMDCDEVFQCPWASTVAAGLECIPEDIGKIDCEVRDYFPTNKDSIEWSYDAANNELMLDVMSVLKVFRIRNRNLNYFRFLRNSDELDLDFGHFAKTKPDKAYPMAMIMHHFPYRSAALAMQKVSNDRLPRISTTDTEKGVGWHYSLVNQLKLPVNMSTANQEVIIVDGRYTTYYLTRK